VLYFLIGLLIEVPLRPIQKSNDWTFGLDATKDHAESEYRLADTDSIVYTLGLITEYVGVSSL
jgi:polysaccharide deacetylase 2 family uncharacterized protein YibQ